MSTHDLMSVQRWPDFRGRRGEDQGNVGGWVAQRGAQWKGWDYRHYVMFQFVLTSDNTLVLRVLEE